MISIFPDYLAGPLRVSLLGKAVERGLLDVHLHDLRSLDLRPAPHRRRHPVRRRGRDGDAARAVGPGAGRGGARGGARLVVPTPAGRPFTQQLAQELAAEPWLVFGCGRYEGIDQRVVDWARRRMPVDEVSIGDYVLAGGEAAVLVIVEAVARLLPGFLGNPDSLAEESHAGGLLEYPVYTRPPSWHGLEVPEVLLSGDHGAVARWRRDESLRRTAARRPDLLAGADLSERDRAALD